jgi:glycosyltransferase involved in cell wall biosynthesis
MTPQKKILYVVNEASFFMSHRLPVARAAQDAGFEVHVAAPADHVWAPDDFDLQVVRDAGFEVHIVPLSRRGKNPFRDLVTLFALMRLYRKIRPDLVHHLTIKPILYGSIAARFCGVKAVVNAVTGLGQVFSDEGLQGRTIRKMIIVILQLSFQKGKFCTIFQNSKDLQTLVSARVVDEDSAFLIRGSGVSLTRYLPKPEVQGRPVVILAARMIWEKGIAEFVGAACILKKAGCSARFALVGNTKLSNPRAVPEETLEQWRKNGDVEWWGRQENMPEIYASSHIVCLPSSYGEGVPLTLIEAAASGRAIVATEAAGQEIVREGQNGMLVPAGDERALADALKILIDDETLRRNMGAEGRKIVEDGFSVDKVIAQTMKVYNGLLA